MTKPLQSEKPARPFGAPESDEDNDGEEDAERDNEPEPSEQERAASPEKELEEKKRIKLHKGERGARCVSLLFLSADTNLVVAHSRS
jgi:DEAD/DEAH box helicase domain-containing protein